MILANRLQTLAFFSKFALSAYRYEACEDCWIAINNGPKTLCNKERKHFLLDCSNAEASIIYAKLDDNTYRDNIEFALKRSCAPIDSNVEMNLKRRRTVSEYIYAGNSEVSPLQINASDPRMIAHGFDHNNTVILTDHLNFGYLDSLMQLLYSTAFKRNTMEPKFKKFKICSQIYLIISSIVNYSPNLVMRIPNLYVELIYKIMSPGTSKFKAWAFNNIQDVWSAIMKTSIAEMLDGRLEMEEPDKYKYTEDSFYSSFFILLELKKSAEHPKFQLVSPCDSIVMTRRSNLSIFEFMIKYPTNYKIATMPDIMLIPSKIDLPDTQIDFKSFIAIEILLEEKKYILRSFSILVISQVESTPDNRGIRYITVIYDNDCWIVVDKKDVFDIRTNHDFFPNESKIIDMLCYEILK